jgi:transcriptional regulator with XRE-family HTH domain
MDTSPRTEGFARILHQHRIAAGISQEALAERAGVSARELSELERGPHAFPRTETLALLIAALGLEGPARAAFEAAARPHVASAQPQRGWNPGPPLSLTSLVGRERDVAAVRQLLSDPAVCLVTLTGTGGVG